MNFYYGQKFEESYPPEAETWAIQHDAHMERHVEEGIQHDSESSKEPDKVYYVITMNEHDYPTTDFYIGQVFEGGYPPEAAVWCTKNQKQIVPDGKNFVIQELPAPTKEEQEQVIRGERDRRLEATYGIAERHRSQKDAGISTTLTEDEYHQLGIYQQNLRDIPQHKDFPWNGNVDQVPWPIKPSFIK